MTATMPLAEQMPHRPKQMVKFLCRRLAERTGRDPRQHELDTLTGMGLPVSVWRLTEAEAGDVVARLFDQLSQEGDE